MNRRDLINKVSEYTGHPQALIEVVLNSIEEIIISELKEYNNISLSGVGQFSSKYYHPKTKIHNITKEEINVEGKIEPKFKFSNCFKAKLNKKTCCEDN